MPLHDWGALSGWDGVHHLWLVELFHWLKPRLPAGYRADIGTTPTVTIGSAVERPDVSVREWPTEPSPEAAPGVATAEAPDVEVVAAPLHLDTALFLERR